MINNLLRRGLYVFAASFFLVIPIQSRPYSSQRKLTQNEFSICIQANGLRSCLKKGREFENILFTKTDESNQLSYTHIFHAKSYKNNVMYEVTLLDLSREKDKLLSNIGGIRNLSGKPDLLVIFDTVKESL